MQRELAKIVKGAEKEGVGVRGRSIANISGDNIGQKFILYILLW